MKNLFGAGELFGKVKKSKEGYFLETYVARVLQEFKLKSPLKIEIKQVESWHRKYCPICGHIGGIHYERPDWFNLKVGRETICNVCAERECPELFKKAQTMSKKMDKEFVEQCRRGADKTHSEAGKKGLQEKMENTFGRAFDDMFFYK